MAKDKLRQPWSKRGRNRTRLLLLPIHIRILSSSINMLASNTQATVDLASTLPSTVGNEALTSSSLA